MAYHCGNIHADMFGAHISQRNQNKVHSLIYKNAACSSDEVGRNIIQIQIEKHKTNYIGSIISFIYEIVVEKI